MKTTVMLAAFLGLITVCCAQDIDRNEVPSVVINSFDSMFPKATDIEWEKKGDIYNIDFDLGLVDHEVWIDTNGKLIKHETDIKKNELPAAVKTAIDKKYADYKLDDADKIEKGGKTYYFIELEGNTGDRNILFDAQGNEIADHSVIY